MDSRERVYNALRRKEVDRVPVFMWFHPQTARRLGELLEVQADDVAEAMGNDIVQTWVSNNYAMEGITHEKDGDGHTDVWGIKWESQDGFNQIVEYPLAGASREEILAYQFPAEHIESLVGLMEPVMKMKDAYFVGCDVSPCVFEFYWRLVGLERGMIDMIEDQELTAEMFKRCGDFSMQLIREVIARCDVDWIWLGDDAGSQGGMLMSPDMWRQLVKPVLFDCIEVVKEAGLIAAFHSCGAISEIIPDLIEIGVDVLNPIQCNCPGMDPLALKKQYGSELAFMGGVDTQGVLPNGTAQEVRSATEKLIKGMTAGGGGYILAASHTVPPETPDENIFAMYEVAGVSKEQIYDKASQIRNKEQ